MNCTGRRWKKNTGWPGRWCREEKTAVKILILSGSPKKPGDGLCQSLIAQAERAAKDAGAEAATLEFSGLERCRVCSDGWGTCLKEHRCAFGEDGFDDAQQAVKQADGFLLITPVYFGEMSESLKAFTDRLRRCEFNSPSAMKGKPALLVASAGGSGNGIVNCLTQMERFCQHTGVKVFDMVGVNRWNQEYKRAAVHAATQALASHIRQQPGS